MRGKSHGFKRHNEKGQTPVWCWPRYLDPGCITVSSSPTGSFGRSCSYQWVYWDALSRRT